MLEHVGGSPTPSRREASPPRPLQEPVRLNLRTILRFLECRYFGFSGSISCSEDSYLSDSLHVWVRGGVAYRYLYIDNAQAQALAVEGPGPFFRTPPPSGLAGRN